MPLETPQLDIVTMMSAFNSHEKCLQVLEDLRWPTVSSVVDEPRRLSPRGNLVGKIM